MILTIAENTIKLLSLLIISLYIPIAVLVYASPQWYDFNCQYHKRCERLGEERVTLSAERLTRYFRHQVEHLEGYWTEKERAHLAEVRTLYDILGLITLIALIFLILRFDKDNIRFLSIINIMIIGWLIIVIPFFGAFWDRIFHPLLFSNDLWKNTKADISYYLMPIVFFKHSVVIIIVSGLIINFTTWFILSKLSYRGRYYG